MTLNPEPDPVILRGTAAIVLDDNGPAVTGAGGPDLTAGDIHRQRPGSLRNGRRGGTVGIVCVMRSGTIGARGALLHTVLGIAHLWAPASLGTEP